MRRHPLFSTHTIDPGAGYEASYEEMAAPLVLGVVWSWCLHGVLVVQFYVYCYNFSRDNKYIKLLVYSIFLLETEQTALDGADLYHSLVASFESFPYYGPYCFIVHDLRIPRTVISLSVQLFFVYRILVLSGKRSWWLCVIICLLSILSALAAFTSGVLSYLGSLETCLEIQGVGKASISIKWSTIVEFIRYISSMLTDLLIASAMLHHLRKIWVRDGKLSDHSFVTMVRLTVETNLATATVGIITFLMLVLYTHEEWSFCPAYIFGKLYSNTLLACLNNRITNRDKCEAHGAVVHCEAVTRLQNSACPESTTNAITLEPERPQNDSMDEPVAGAEVKERVNIPTNAETV